MRRLKNKKTGENYEMTMPIVFNIKTSGGGEHTVKCESIKELNEKWTDYEEPKEYWFIDYDGGILCREYDNSSAEKMMISMGNHFNSLEEAEKVVERLRAWKRLKDYNVMFNLDFVKNKIDFTYSINNLLLDVLDGEEQIFNNMKIVFGGEE